MAIETRSIPGKMTVSKRADGARVIAGYAAVFNSRSELLGGWFEEIIRPGAFRAALAGSDPRCLWNHDPNYVLGRAGAGTLSLREDDRGLYMECTLPDTQIARDLAASIERGDVDGQSFSFTTKTDRWTYSNEPGKPALREILEVDGLFDVGPVAYPAYPKTDVGVRSVRGLECLDAARQAWEANNAALTQDLDGTRRRRLRLAELECDAAAGQSGSGTIISPAVSRRVEA
jgi:HK97 family phage prohead protease